MKEEEFWFHDWFWLSLHPPKGAHSFTWVKSQKEQEMNKIDIQDLEVSVSVCVRWNWVMKTEKHKPIKMAKIQIQIRNEIVVHFAYSNILSMDLLAFYCLSCFFFSFVISFSLLLAIDTVEKLEWFMVVMTSLVSTLFVRIYIDKENFKVVSLLAVDGRNVQCAFHISNYSTAM